MSVEEKVSEQIQPGLNIKVHYRIHEGAKTRVQPYEGMVIALKGSGVSRTFTVRHAGVDNIGVERIFPLHSPNIERIEILSQSRVRRAKLYYVRNLTAKMTSKIEKE